MLFLNPKPHQAPHTQHGAPQNHFLYLHSSLLRLLLYEVQFVRSRTYSCCHITLHFGQTKHMHSCSLRIGEQCSGCGAASAAAACIIQLLLCITSSSGSSSQRALLLLQVHL
jgi:hypothetical protein